MTDHKKLARKACDNAVMAWAAWKVAQADETDSETIVEERFQTAKYWNDRAKRYERMELGGSMAAHNPIVKLVLADYEEAASG